jgi:hypothetical protein
MSIADRYKSQGDLKDLDAALQAIQQALDLTPRGHPDRAGRLNALGTFLVNRCHRVGDLKDLEAAVKRHCKRQ